MRTGLMNSGLDVMCASVSMAMMFGEAQAVIAMRTLGMAGFWPLAPDEHKRMWAEKAEAALRSGYAVSHALASGRSPAAVTLAAVHPLRRRTRANLRRLSGAKGR
ncbi:MAG: hypothetical protein H6895_11925 [Defluviimonas sp.]|uniref:hypothetical protein n=1 Tax=Albidovulum sp. TaxID=1872424 RepID=UPI001D3A6C82|nr:hypothetical protein [Paracoccaceae bacterium]MCC0064778.1 hypothetical protein [Defluviimonas sp.]